MLKCGFDDRVTGGTDPETGIACERVVQLTLVINVAIFRAVACGTGEVAWVCVVGCCVEGCGTL